MPGGRALPRCCLLYAASADQILLRLTGLPAVGPQISPGVSPSIGTIYLRWPALPAGFIHTSIRPLTTTSCLASVRHCCTCLRLPLANPMHLYYWHNDAHPKPECLTTQWILPPAGRGA